MQQLLSTLVDAIEVLLVCFSVAGCTCSYSSRKPQLVLIRSRRKQRLINNETKMHTGRRTRTRTDTDTQASSTNRGAKRATKEKKKALPTQAGRTIVCLYISSKGRQTANTKHNHHAQRTTHMYDSMRTSTTKHAPTSYYCTFCTPITAHATRGERRR